MAKKKEHGCAERVYAEGAVFGGDCAREGKHREGGKWWCWQHCPSKVKARRDARRQKWQDEDVLRDALDKKRWRRQAAECKACKGINTAALEAGVVKALVEACEAVLCRGIECLPGCGYKTTGACSCRAINVLLNLRAALALATPTKPAAPENDDGS